MADKLIGVFVPINLLNSVAALSGFLAALLYALDPTYLFPLLSIKIADGVTSYWSGLLYR
jgi:hypothetical protein